MLDRLSDAEREEREAWPQWMSAIWAAGTSSLSRASRSLKAITGPVSIDESQREKEAVHGGSGFRSRCRWFTWWRR